MAAAANMAPEPFVFDPKQHAGIVWREVRRWGWAADAGALELRDLESAGMEALAIAATKFDPAMGFRFITYAAHWVREKVKREALDRCRTVRIPAREALKRWQRGNPYPVHSISLDSTLQDEDGGATTYLSDLLGEVTEHQGEESAMGEALQDAVASAIDELPERLAFIVRCRFFEDMTLDEVGKQLGVSRERVRQQQVEALALLKKRLADNPALADLLGGLAGRV